MNRKLMPNRWLLVSATALACAYLLPNHSPPWVSFHGDAWAATVLASVAVWVFAHQPGRATLAPLTLLTVLACFIPFLQFAWGQNRVFGVAWIHGIYLVGFLVALRLGEVWEQTANKQPADFIFLAVGIAAVVSTALQIHQWMGFEPIGIWTMAASGSRRMYANMAQPNQLASLLLLGLLGIAWAFHRKRLAGSLAIVVALLVLAGIALTESRTAWLNLGLIYVGALALRKRLPHPAFLQVVTALVLVFAAFAISLPWINQSAGFGAGGEAGLEQHRALSDPVRLKIWTLALDAAAQRPWFGYGWGRVIEANFSVINGYPGQLVYFNSSHNLLLDLVLWNGYPLGVAIALLLAVWWWQRMRRVTDFSQGLMLAFITVLLVHGLLELPLQYAFFLLPFGVMAGALQAAQKTKPLGAFSKWWDRFALALATLALGMTISDYFKIETSYLGLRLENANVPTSISKAPPKVLVLDQFVEYLILARNTPQAGLNERQLADMELVVNTIPSPRVVQRLAQNYALNGKPEKAIHWLRILCKTLPEPNCSEMRDEWVHDPLYKSVDWPLNP